MELERRFSLSELTSARKQVNKFLSALSTLQQPLVTPSPTRSTASPVARKLPPASSVSVHSSSKHFDAFLRSIAKLKTLGEARRLKADVERELRNLSLEPMDKGDERAERKRKRYQQRLEKARAQIDDRITVLSGPSPVRHMHCFAADFADSFRLLCSCPPGLQATSSQ